MPFPSANEQDRHYGVRQDSGTNERVMQWIRRLEFLQTPNTPRTEASGDNPGGTTTAGSRSPTWSVLGPNLQNFPFDNVVEVMVPTTIGVAYPFPQSSDHGTANELGHPPAPMVLAIPLPTAEETETTPSEGAISSAAVSSQHDPTELRPIDTRLYQNEGLGAHHIHHQLPSSVQAAVPIMVNRSEQTPGSRPVQRVDWYLNAALRFHESIRPVIEPVLSDMPPYPGHRWGARDQDSSCIGEINVHFPCSMIPATNPPLTRMRLSRPFGGKLVVVPSIGNQFVSVGDVQKVVVAWMRWEEPHVRDDGLQLTRKESIRSQNGTTISVEVWVWRGLKKSTGGTDEWEINL